MTKPRRRWSGAARSWSERRRSTPARSVCCVCAGPTAIRWQLPVLGGRHAADYDECTACGLLQVREAPWLGEAYEREGQPHRTDPDTGRMRRAISACLYLFALDKGGAIRLDGPTLDYGGGHALVTQMLFDLGTEAWTYDPHIRPPLFASTRAIPSLEAIPEGTLVLATAFEVVEHLLDPMRDLLAIRRRLAKDGSFVFSTGIYRSGVHGPDWPYLATEWGQHVTLWSDTAIDIAAGHLGFRSVGYFPGGDGFLVVLSALDPGELQAALERSARYLDDAGGLGLLATLDFRSDGVVVPATPIARASRVTAGAMSGAGPSG